MIKAYRCDEPMAKKKGIRQVCDRKCKNCICALAMSESGHEYHVGFGDGGTCANVMRRNKSMGLYQKPDGTSTPNDRSRVDWRFDRRRSD